MDVKDHMQAITMTVSPNHPSSTAHRIMNDLLIRHPPIVLDGNRLVGILTDRNIRMASPSRGVHLTDRECNDARQAMTVSEVMTRQVNTMSPDATLLEAATLFLEQKFDCLPVVDADVTLNGLMTVSDFVRVYVEQHDNIIF